MYPQLPDFPTQPPYPQHRTNTHIRTSRNRRAPAPDANHPLAILLLLCIALAGNAVADTLTAGTFGELHTAISTAPTDGSVRTILITQDIPVGASTSDIFTIAAKQNITLPTDAGPHKIYRTGVPASNKSMIYLNNSGTFTMDGSIITANHAGNYREAESITRAPSP